MRKIDDFDLKRRDLGGTPCLLSDDHPMSVGRDTIAGGDIHADLLPKFLDTGLGLDRCRSVEDVGGQPIGVLACRRQPFLSPLHVSFSLGQAEVSDENLHAAGFALRLDRQSRDLLLLDGLRDPALDAFVA